MARCLAWAVLGVAAGAPATSVPLRKARRMPGLEALRASRRLAGAVDGGGLASAPLRGDLMDDYTAEVEIEGRVFHLNVDTGSGVVGVAGNRSIGCDAFYDAAACAGPALEVTYGSGYWRGVVCAGRVAVGGLGVAGYRFAAYTEQRAMTTCARTPADDPTAPAMMVRPDAFMEGILGASFAQGTSAGSPPLLEAIFDAHPDVARAFGPAWKSTGGSDRTE